MRFLEKAFCVTPQAQLLYTESQTGQKQEDIATHLVPPATNECDYDKNPTQLYQLLEMRLWTQAMNFMIGGNYESHVIKNDSCEISPEKQASIWISRYEQRAGRRREIRWSHIPLHAAIIFGAPLRVTQQILKQYPDGIRCSDDQAMLPLHLAFKHSSPVNTLRLLIDAFPDALFTKDNRGRLPSDVRQDERSMIISRVIMCVSSRIRQETEDRDTKEIAKLRKGLLEKKRDTESDEKKARRNEAELQNSQRKVGELQNKIKVLQVDLKNMEKSSRYSFPFMNEDQGMNSNTEDGFHLRRCVELEAENEELVLKVKALEEASRTPMGNQENMGNGNGNGNGMIHITDDDVLRFTDLSDELSSERKKLEQERQKSDLLDAENKRLKEAIDRIESIKSKKFLTNNNAGEDYRKSTFTKSISSQEHFEKIRMAPVGVGVKDLESFLESRLLKELDVENRVLERQIQNRDADIEALLNKQKRLQEMEREVKASHQGASCHQLNGGILSASQSTGKGGHSNDALIKECKRVHGLVAMY